MVGILRSIQKRSLQSIQWHERGRSLSTGGKGKHAQTSATKPGSSAASRARSSVIADSNSAKRRISRGSDMSRLVGVVPVKVIETSDATVVSAMTT